MQGRLAIVTFKCEGQMIFISDKEQFTRWVNNAKPGSSIIYYQGHLARDLRIGDKPSVVARLDDDIIQKRMLSDAVRLANLHGLVVLLQKRVSDEDGEPASLYIAERTRMPICAAEA